MKPRLPSSPNIWSRIRSTGQVRAQRAESLLRLHQPCQARRDFAQAVAHIQEAGPDTTRALIHCHRRLLEIAQLQDDEYAERLERGIALHWLACERSLLVDAEGDCSREGLLFKSLSELMEAHVLRPEEARPCWYLSVVWSKLEQSAPATRWRRLAQAAAPFTYLTPAEQRNLQLARPFVADSEKFSRW